MDSEKLFEKMLALLSNLYTLELELTKDLELETYTPLQFKAIQTIYLHAPATTSSIAHCLGLTLPNASRELQKLISGGLVVKEQDKTDKRVHWLQLTEKGLAFVSRTLGEVKLRFEHLLGGMSEVQKAEFSKAIDHISEHLPK